MKYCAKYKALKSFTLAEVLITLGIIGLVAEFTIPTLYHDFMEQNYKIAYKKAFSVANNAFKQATADGTTYVPVTGSDDGVNACINWQIFSSQFKKFKECINSDTKQCWNMNAGIETSNGAPKNNSLAFIDASGMAWTMRGTCDVNSSYGNTYFLMDTNGFKGPNKFGKDRWVFNWVLDNDDHGIPTKIFILYNRDFTPGQTSDYVCPTGPCYYQSWLLN